MILADLHTHSYFSSDSTAKLTDMITSALNKGLTTLCFTDHMDYDYPKNDEGQDFIFDVPKYFEEIENLREQYKDKIKLLTGIELGLMPHLNNRYEELASSFNFDFIIGSTHLINGIDPYYPEYFKTNPDKQGINLYFEYVLENITSNNSFSVCGHIDYVVRYLDKCEEKYNPNDYQDIIDHILSTLIKRGKGIEVNTSSLSNGLSFPNPHPYIIKRYKELGGEIITIGSDAHKPQNIAHSFAIAEDILTNAGFKYYTVFEKQKPIFYKF